MKKQIIFFVMLFAGLTLMAKPVEPEKAVQVAKNFVAQYVKGADQYSAEVVYTHLMPKSQHPAMYVVNVGNMFVLVAADDVAHPVLGYSLSRPWPTESEELRMKNEESADEGVKLPSQVVGYLDDLAGQIESAASSALPLRQGVSLQGEGVDISAEWHHLLTVNSQLSTTNPPDSVGPLLTTTWGQGQYYNALCPEDANGPDGHVYTGCVATAMAQIINYWGYPVHGRGTHSYESNYGTLTVNYDSATYDYANMPTALTSASTPAQVNAVATLMRDCGVAANMSYSAVASGATAAEARAGMINNFLFSDSVSYVKKAYLSDSEWDNLLRENIDRGCPLYYAGGAHAFICDGYKQGDYFHFNFGWGGYVDGWFLTSSVYGLNSRQEILVDIFPDSIYNGVFGNVGNSQYVVSEAIDFFNHTGLNPNTTPLVNGVVNETILFIPDDTTQQLVVDILDYDINTDNETIAIYDGTETDNYVRFITWADRDNLDFSPVVSTRHSITIVIYDDVNDNNGCHLRISKADSCRMASNVTSVVDTTHCNVSWDGNGASTSWKVEYGEAGFTVGEGTSLIVDTTFLSVNFENANSEYEFRIQPICDTLDNELVYSIIVNKRKYWTDIVSSQPEGFSIDSEGIIHVSSAEGLAWISKGLIDCWNAGGFWDALYEHNISIENDIDLSGYLWWPILNWYGDFNGNGHIISNMTVKAPGRQLSGGLFSSFMGDTIKNIGFNNCYVEGKNAGTIAGLFSQPLGRQCVAINCYSDNYMVSSGNRGYAGGLFGGCGAEIINCYSRGKLLDGYAVGGLSGSAHKMRNSYTSVELIENFGWRGLISGTTRRGPFINCFADIAIWENELSSDDEPESFFWGDAQNIDLMRNIAGFTRQGNTMAHILPDTTSYQNKINYHYENDIDLVTVLNRYVVEMNSPLIRTWIWDSITRLPVFGNYHVVLCPNISNLQASNVPYGDGSAIALSWTENGSATEWMIKCLPSGVTDEDSAIYFSSYSTSDTIIGLTLHKQYDIYIRPVCIDDTFPRWGIPLSFWVDKAYWADVVTSCPEGYVEDANGNIAIYSPEGLTWLSVCSNGLNGQPIKTFEGKTISIMSDLDMGAYRWTPISRFLNDGRGIQFSGSLYGWDHSITNLYCHEDDSWSVGLIGLALNAYVRDLRLTNCTFEGVSCVGSIIGDAGTTVVDNCHAINVYVVGTMQTGGLLGYAGGTIRNSSSSGFVFGDQTVGGLIGFGAIATNCYSIANVMNLGKMRSEYKGGLFGETGTIANCYSAGYVEYVFNIYGNSTGSSVGMPYPDCFFESVYGIMQDSMPLFGDMTFLGDPYFSDTATFNSNGCFETAVIIGGQSYTNLLSALNAWVDANDSEGIYRRWAADSTNENGGYPVFAAIPCTPTTGTDSIVVCDSYTWHSSLYTESTTLTDTLVNIAGCDSIVTHHLVVNHSVSRTDTVSAMESYTWADSTYTTSGIYQHTWPAVNGCDSTVNLWLTITTTVYDTLYITLTDTVTNTVYDTITNTVYDTVDNYIYDTTLVTVTDTLWMTEYDTLYITLTDTVYIHDTIYVPQEGIGDVTITNVKLYQREGCIVVEGAAGMTVRVYDAVGRAVSTPQSLRDSSPVSGEQQVRIAVPTSGVYLVKVGDAPVRRVVVIR